MVGSPFIGTNKNPRFGEDITRLVQWPFSAKAN
jgi:hypothetical protein